MTAQSSKKSSSSESSNLRLMATDKEGLQTISALLQDSLVPYVSMVYSPEEKRFFLQAMRFRWENYHKDKSNSDKLERTFSTVVFNNVLSVHKNNFSQTQSHHLEFSLLTIEMVSDSQLRLNFSEEKSAIITVEKLEVFLGDHDESWPTNYNPNHT